MKKNITSTNKKSAPIIGGRPTSGVETVADSKMGINLDHYSGIRRKEISDGNQAFLEKYRYSDNSTRQETEPLSPIPIRQDNAYKSKGVPKKRKKRLVEKAVSGKTFNHDIADFLLKKHQFAVIDKNLHYWNERLKYYVGLVGNEADHFIRQNIPDELKENITIRSSEEVVRWLIAKEQLKVEQGEFVKRKQFVPFKNLVVRYSDLSLHEHSPEGFFTSVINANYPIGENPSGINFENFMEWVTDGNTELYLRMQELFGYVLSEIRDVKVIPFLLGPKDSGKSIVLKLLVNLVGEEFSSSLSLEEMNRSEFVCNLFGKKLNACGEISELPLKRLDTLKKLSGGDYIMARFLYSNAIKFVNQAALVFAGNHLPIMKSGIDRTNAFVERLRIFPFPNQVPKENQDIHLLDKLLEERSYIAKWSLEGLRRWSEENNFEFTTCNMVEELIQIYSESTSSIKSFINDVCVINPDLRTHNSVLYPAYRTYCIENEFNPESDKAFHKHMQQIEGFRHDRFRENERNQYGYYGIGLQEQ